MDGSFFKDVKSIHRKISSKWEVYSHKYKERNSLIVFIIHLKLLMMLNNI
jgi:hypothetical protein